MIQFKKVIIHNFGSYGHVELELQNRGFCLVSGQNNYTKDNALSNGAGKSALWNAICYALTGETINGSRTNLKNINIDEPDCFVQLEFLYQKYLFSVCRVVAPKSELKIFRNDIDLSGKGIRESEKKLQELIPELTKDLIASTIIIGQGMPNKFSSFSPSGRKELLEKLTKSDFMIEDLKQRIANRQQELTAKIREFEDSLLTNRTKLNGYVNNLEKLKLAIDQQKPEFDTLIATKKERVLELESNIAYLQEEVLTSERQLENLSTKLLEITTKKAEVNKEELLAYNKAYNELSSKKVKLEVEISNLNKEISKLKSVTDICPTCNQKLPNVHKPDTKELEATLSSNQTALSSINSEITKCKNQHNVYQKQIDDAFEGELSVVNAALEQCKHSVQALKAQYSTQLADLEREKTLYTKLLYDQQNWSNFIKKQQEEIAVTENEIANLTNLLSITSISKDDFDQHLAVVKKMDQLTKRDFRGYLLANLISYIDIKAKKYCETVFGTTDLSIEINGNALDITYCGKTFDSLSGGEKQRVDLILQLAIRDLLNSYLGLSANILVLDEITDFLDKKSCKAVMQLLEKELHTIESVFIISHHAEELELPVDSEIKVIKNEYGISELY